MKRSEFLSVGIGFGVLTGMLYNYWNGNSSHFQVEFEDILEDHQRLSEADFNSKYNRYGNKVYNVISGYLSTQSEKISNAICNDIESKHAAHELRSLLGDSSLSIYARIEKLKTLIKNSEDMFKKDRQEIASKLKAKNIVFDILTEEDIEKMLAVENTNGDLKYLAEALIKHVYVGADINDADITYCAQNYVSLQGINHLIDFVSDNSLALNKLSSRIPN